LFKAFWDEQSAIGDSATQSEQWGEALRTYVGGSVEFVTELITGRTSKWATSFISAGSIFRSELQASTDVMVRALVGHETYVKTMDKISAATEFAAKHHVSLTTAIYDLAHGINVGTKATEDGAKAHEHPAKAVKAHAEAAVGLVPFLPPVIKAMMEIEKSRADDAIRAQAQALVAYGIGLEAVANQMKS